MLKNQGRLNAVFTMSGDIFVIFQQDKEDVKKHIATDGDIAEVAKMVGAEDVVNEEEEQF